MSSASIAVGAVDGGGRAYRGGDGALLCLLETGADCSEVSLPLSTDFGGDGGSLTGSADSVAPLTFVSDRSGKSDKVSTDIMVAMARPLQKWADEVTIQQRLRAYTDVIYGSREIRRRLIMT